MFGHFQRENAHGRAFADGGTHGEVEGEGGFAHRRARRDDDQIRRLEPPCDGVEFGIASSEPGNPPLCGFEHGVHHVSHERLHRPESAGTGAAGYRHNGLLGLVDEPGQIL